MHAAVVAPPVKHGQQDGTKEGEEEEFVNLMQPPPRIKKKGKKGKKKGPAADALDALARLEELDTKTSEVRVRDRNTFTF